jgi:hypothetical protein
LKQKLKVYYKGHTFLGSITCEKKKVRTELKKIIVEKKDGFYPVVPKNYVCPIIAKKHSKMKNWKEFINCLEFRKEEENETKNYEKGDFE